MNSTSHKKHILGVYSKTSQWLSVHRLWRAKLKVFDSVAGPECLSLIPIFSIPESYFFHPVSWICIKEIKYFNPQMVSKISEYDLGCLPLIPDLEIKKAPDPGSATLVCEIRQPF